MSRFQDTLLLGLSLTKVGMRYPGITIKQVEGLTVNDEISNKRG